MKMRVMGLGLAAAACLFVANCGSKSAGDQQAGPASSEPAAAPAEGASVSLAAKPAQIGDCVESTITLVGPRLEGVPDSGSSVQYANGMSQVDYDVVPAIKNSQIGDAVRICLVSVPENCPAGDDRGRVYAATNLRSNETWQAPDSQHSCGGA